MQSVEASRGYNQLRGSRATGATYNTCCDATTMTVLLALNMLVAPHIRVVTAKLVRRSSGSTREGSVGTLIVWTSAGLSKWLNPHPPHESIKY